jgi:aminopeptidase N
MTVDSCKANSSLATFSRPGNKLNVDLGASYNVGDSFTVEVYYHGNPSAGFYFDFNNYGPPVYYSITEPYDSRYWFPCYDWPNDKALCEVICTAPEGNIAVSNGELLSLTHNPDTTVTYHWKEDYPIVTYLISLTVCDFAQIDTFAVVSGDTLPIQYWIYHQDSTDAVIDFQKTPEMVEFFSDLWLDYPFPGEKYSMAQAELGGAMEHQTCTSWGFPMPGNAAYEWVVAHELAHQWWGDLVTCNDFANIWLNEGSASYSEVLWEEYEYGESAYKNHLAGFESNIYAARFGSVSHPIYNPPPNYLFATAVYKKGAWVLHMLRYILGDTSFFDGWEAYGQAYAYSTANTEQFKTEMENSSGQDLDDFFNQWVYQANYPVYHWSWAYTSIGGNYYLDLSINQNQSAPSVYKMPIEFQVTTAGGDSLFTLQDTLRDQEFSLILDAAPNNLIFDPDYWVLSADTLYAYPHKAGDVDGNGSVQLGDVIYLANLILKGWPLPSPVAAADANGNCSITLGDAIYLVNHILKSGPDPHLGCP